MFMLSYGHSPLIGETYNSSKVHQVNSPLFPLRCVMVQLNQSTTYLTVEIIVHITGGAKYDRWPCNHKKCEQMKFCIEFQIIWYNL